ncbi:DUF6233 domain-containing protein [Streptomyces sp. NPDC056468]|uniref:DUF6233 domain-containing protein n=1 Tax=unclassified Streptomyces TaxID=2593676 RepID=UPI00369BB411
MRVRHALRVERIDHKIAAVQQRQAEEEHLRRNRPEPPDWIVELGIASDHTPVQVHADDCHIAGKRHRAVSCDEARRLLTGGLPGCTPGRTAAHGRLTGPGADSLSGRHPRHRRARQAASSNIRGYARLSCDRGD